MSDDRDSARKRPPGASQWRGEREAVHASEDDLAAFLRGEVVRLPNLQPGRTVQWHDETGEGLALSEIEELRDEGLDQWVAEPTSRDGRSVVTIRVGAPQEHPGQAESDAITVSLSGEAYRTLCGLVQRREVLDPRRVHGSAWGELRRTFPAAGFVSDPSERIEVTVVAPSAKAAAKSACGAIAEYLAAHPQYVVLTPIRGSDGRYSVTIIVHSGA